MSTIQFYTWFNNIVLNKPYWQSFSMLAAMILCLGLDIHDFASRIVLYFVTVIMVYFTIRDRGDVLKWCGLSLTSFAFSFVPRMQWMHVLFHVFLHVGIQEFYMGLLNKECNNPLN